MSKKVLVAYASVSGSTGEVAEAIGQVLGKQEGVTVEVRRVRDVTDIGVYSAVVLGSSIRVGKWLPEAIQFLETHQESLGQVPVAYFTTCLTMVNDTEDSRRTVLAYMEPVLQKSAEIKPVGLGLFAGSLDPNRPLVMQTDLAPQGDYRDWEAIRAWAEEVAPALMEGIVESDQPLILREAIMRYPDMAGADLSRADLNEIDLIKADLRKADLVEASLQKAGLKWAKMGGANISNANLSRANLIGADLNRADLSRANLSQAVLNGANLEQANLSEADLSYADLNWANLSKANLRYADLSEASLGWANLSGADLSHANLSKARYNNQTQWPEGFSLQAHGVILVRVE